MLESPATAFVSGVMIGAGGSNHGCSDSVDSSPRSRGGDSWDEFPAAAAANASSRLRFMCSYGGRIMPRPTDKSLCYLGGETRIVVVDRHSSLGELTAKLSRKLLSGRPFTLKYQLPNEDLDSLISVTTDEDLENMVDEYDRLLAGSGSSNGGASGGSSAAVGCSGRSGRLRLFLFPAKSESAPASSMGSLLDESKSETWFEDALNSAVDGMGMDGLPRGLSADSACVDLLLGLEDDAYVNCRGRDAAINGVRAEPEPLVIPRLDSSGKLPRQVQDVQSIPDSPMLDKTSSFGSTSSAPSLSNLPPIRVCHDERPVEHRLDDQFAQMNLSSVAADSTACQRLDEGFKQPLYLPQHQGPPIPPVSTPNSAPTFSPSENPNRIFSSDNEKPDHGGVRKQNPVKSGQIDTNILDSSSRPVYVNANSDPKRDIPVPNPAYQVPNIVVADSAGYLLQQEQLQQHQQMYSHPHHHQQQEQLQQHQQMYSHPHHHQQQEQVQQHQQMYSHPHHHQQQYIPANPHYIHHQAVPLSSYYPISSQSIQQSQQAQPYDPQVPVYYVPVPYNLATVQPSLGNPEHMQTALKQGMPVPRVPPKSDLRASLYSTGAVAPSPGTLQRSLIHVAADQAHPYAGMGYHLVQHHHLSQSPVSIGNYGYEYAADSSHPQIFYPQATSAPGLTSQYQTVSSSSPRAAEGIAPGDAKATRTS